MEEEVTIIEVAHAEKRFGRTEVLKDVSFQVAKGSICGIVGRNGSGKTVLFKAICGLHRLSKGTIRVNGAVLGEDMEMPEKVGCIIETPGFLGQFSGYRNLKYLADIRKKIGKKEIYQAMEQVGLPPGSRKPVGKYSLGMRQRLGIAQAFMEGQELLILDEPMNGLDNRGVEDMRKLFFELRDSGKTILLASHNKADIEILCDKVYEMDAGVLIPLK